MRPESYKYYMLLLLESILLMIVSMQEGVMQTHDEETKRFFKHSSVHCVLSPRYASNKLSIFKQQVWNVCILELNPCCYWNDTYPIASCNFSCSFKRIPLVQVVGTLFTHHQKCVLLDTASGNNRKITAFIGGLDMCDGRYDTPEHRLFKDVGSVFQNDIHNPTFPVSSDSTSIRLSTFVRSMYDMICTEAVFFILFSPFQLCYDTGKSVHFLLNSEQYVHLPNIGLPRLSLNFANRLFFIVYFSLLFFLFCLYL